MLEEEKNEHKNQDPSPFIIRCGPLFTLNT